MMKQVSILLSYLEGNGTLTWEAGFPGSYAYLFVNGAKNPALQGVDHGKVYSYVRLELEKGEEIVVNIP